MRLVLIGLVVLSASVAAYFQFGMRSSYSGHSGNQLDVLDHEFRRLGDTATEDQRVSRYLLEREERRRAMLVTSVTLCVLAALGAIFVRGPTRPLQTGLSAEEQRLTAAMGDPKAALNGARAKAAKLLGVMPDAPTSVVEAALAAQLRDRDPNRLEGLAPDLQRLVKDQRDELNKARDLLLQRRKDG